MATIHSLVAENGSNFLLVTKVSSRDGPGSGYGDSLERKVDCRDGPGSGMLTMPAIELRKR